MNSAEDLATRVNDMKLEDQSELALYSRHRNPDRMVIDIDENQSHSHDFRGTTKKEYVFCPNRSETNKMCSSPSIESECEPLDKERCNVSTNISLPLVLPLSVQGGLVNKITGQFVDLSKLSSRSQSSLPMRSGCSKSNKNQIKNIGPDRKDRSPSKLSSKISKPISARQDQIDVKARRSRIRKAVQELCDQ